MDVAGAGANAPEIFRQAFAVNVTAARFGMEATVEAFDGDVAGAGANLDIARAGFVEFDVAAARLGARGT